MNERETDFDSLVRFHEVVFGRNMLAREISIAESFFELGKIHEAANYCGELLEKTNKEGQK
jgi:hypothetical protein